MDLIKDYEEFKKNRYIELRRAYVYYFDMCDKPLVYNKFRELLISDDNLEMKVILMKGVKCCCIVDKRYHLKDYGEIELEYDCLMKFEDICDDIRKQCEYKYVRPSRQLIVKILKYHNFENKPIYDMNTRSVTSYYYRS